MENSIISETGKKCKKIWERVQKSLLPRWAWVKPVLTKNADILLFVLALAVLTAALFRTGNRIPLAPVPDIVFAQWWQDDIDNNTLEQLVKEFENLHEGIKVVIKTVPYDKLEQELSAPPESASSVSDDESSADVIALDPLWVPELINRGTIDNRPDNTPAAPLLSFINVFYYNIQILKEAGFSRPPKNRSEFLRYAKAVAGLEGNRRALASGGNSSRSMYDDIFPWIWAAGAQLYKDGKPAVTSKPVVESLSFLASLNKEGLIAPGVFSTGSDADTGNSPDRYTKNKIEDFISGKAAFMVAPASYIKQIREQMGDENFGVSSVPPPDNFPGKYYYGSLGWTIGIASSSPHKEEAQAFVEFLNSKASLLSEKAKAISGNSSPYPGPDPFYSKVWDIAIAGETTPDFSGGGNSRAFQEIFREELIKLFAGNFTPEQTAKAIQARWEEVNE